MLEAMSETGRSVAAPDGGLIGGEVADAEKWSVGRTKEYAGSIGEFKFSSPIPGPPGDTAEPTSDKHSGSLSSRSYSARSSSRMHHPVAASPRIPRTADADHPEKRIRRTLAPRAPPSVSHTAPLSQAWAASSCSKSTLTRDACRSVSTRSAESSKNGTSGWRAYANVCESGTRVVGVGARGMRRGVEKSGP